MARPAGAWAAGCACLLLVAAAVLTPGGRPDAAARAALLATGRAEAAPEQLLLHGYERVAHTKKLLELRGRTLAKQIRSLTRAVDREEIALKRHGVHVKASDLEDFKSDVDSIKASFSRVRHAAKLSAAAMQTDAHGKKLPAKVRVQQKKLLDKARKLVDSAIKDDTQAAEKRSAVKKDDAAYKEALIEAAQANTAYSREKAKLKQRAAEAALLKKEKGLLKARERREALERKNEAKATALQREIDATISRAVKSAKRDLAGKKTPSKPAKGVVLKWAAAAEAAKRGDTRAVHSFCNSQADSQSCAKALLRHGTSKKPCNPEMAGYFRCLGVEDTGGTLG